MKISLLHKISASSAGKYTSSNSFHTKTACGGGTQQLFLPCSFIIDETWTVPADERIVVTNASCIMINILMKE